MTTLRITTDYGLLSVIDRKGYFYAVRTHNQQKRQVYLGRSIPDTHSLNEVAKDIFSSDMEWTKRHPPRSEKLRARLKDTKNISLRDDLLRIAELARALGEPRIEKELRQILTLHF